MSSTYLQLTLYVTRAPHDRAWALDLLRRLWQHGLEFGTTLAVPNWQSLAGNPRGAPWLLADLERRYHASALGDWQAVKAFWQDEIERFLAEPDTGFTLWDRGVDLELQLDTDLRYLGEWLGDRADRLTPLTYGKVTLRVNRILQSEDQRMPSHSDVPAGGYLMSPARQVFMAFAHWARVLCQEIAPAYAFGYHSAFLDEQVFADDADLDVITLLMRGRVPQISEWLGDVRVEYVAPALVTPALRQQWLAMPERWVGQLLTGGLFAMKARDSHEVDLMRQHEWQAHELAAPGCRYFGDGEGSRADAMRYHYERALAIARENGMADDAQWLGDHLRWLDEHGEPPLEPEERPRQPTQPRPPRP